ALSLAASRRVPDRTHQRSFPTRRSSDLVDYDRLEKSTITGHINLLENTPQEKILPLTTASMLVINLLDSDLFSGRQFPFQNGMRSEEHTSELQSREKLVCRLLLTQTNTE